MCICVYNLVHMRIITKQCWEQTHFCERLHTCSIVGTFGWLRHFGFLIQIYTLLLLPLSQTITSGTLINSALSIARIHRGWQYPHQLRYLHITWLIEIYTPNHPWLDLFWAAIISPRLALSGNPKWHNLRFSRLNRPCKYFLGWKL